MSSTRRPGWCAIALLDILLLIACLTEGKIVGSMRSPSTDEPSEQGEVTTGDSNPGIVTIVRMVFVYLQRRLI